MRRRLLEREERLLMEQLEIEERSKLEYRVDERLTRGLSDYQLEKIRRMDELSPLLRSTYTVRRLDESTMNDST
jgi:hypothetical protein